MSATGKPDPNKTITVEDVLAALRTKKLGDVFTDAQISEIAVLFSTKDVAEIHRDSDLDLRRESYHHTLGSRSVQASPGDHTHDGGSSPSLLDGIIFTGSRGSATASVLAQVLNALTGIGATNSTSA